ncbi:MAG: hypothetical protein IT373_12290 [Polyangiaceae bacterium]|nr:hypothetical protein [Polyangiaceae bacterium]
MDANRRNCLAVLVALGLSLVGSSAWAGSYLNRAALLLDEARVEQAFVRPRMDDRELVETAHALAEARNAAAHAMRVPKAIASAHPHLLLVFEDYERAFAALLAGQPAQFAELVERARAEEHIFRDLIGKLGYGLPAVPR